MNSCGRDCTLAMQIGSRILNLPYAAETLRDATVLLEREALIDEDRNQNIEIRTHATGCVVTPLTITSVPSLLAFVFGAEEEAEWMSETRSLYRHLMTQQYEAGIPTAEIIQDRIVSCRRFKNLRCSGYELRGSAGERILLKMDFRSDRKSEDAGRYLNTALAPEEFFDMDSAILRVNGSDCPGFYAFSLLVDKAAARVELRLHSVLDETSARLLGVERIEGIELDFFLRRDRNDERRYGRFVITAKNLILLVDETGVDSPDEVIGPRRFLVNGCLSAEVYTSDEGRLLR